MDDAILRPHLLRLLRGRGARAEAEAVLRHLDPALVGERPAGVEHSAWQLVEHLRLAQRDILDFCRDPDYEEPRWPEDYWPADPRPPRPGAFEDSVDGFLADLDAACAMAEDPAVDLAAIVPASEGGATILRELLLVADHNAYHLGQLVLLRRLLGAWPPAS